jgi:flagellar hook-associated protein 2
MFTTTSASDSSVQVGGSDDQGGYTLSSDTNTFTGLMAGVTLTVSKVETGVSLTSANDVGGIAAKIKAMVDAANGTLTEVGNQTAYDSSTNTGSPLTGDFMVRQMSQSILSNVSRGLSYPDPNDATKTVAFGSLAKLGIQLDKTGQLTFDADKFTAAYNADPTAIKAAGIALGDSFEALAKTQNDNVTNAITSRNQGIDSLNLQIDNWDVRLTAKQASLQKTYSNLETALGSLKNQSSWLSGQIASLG